MSKCENSTKFSDHNFVKLDKPLIILPKNIKDEAVLATYECTGCGTIADTESIENASK